MKIVFRLFLLGVTVYIINGCSTSQDEKKSVIIKPLFIPEVVVIDEKLTLYYELQVLNQSSDSITLTKLEIIDTADSKFFMVFEKDELSGRISSIESSQTISNNTIPPGASSLIYVEIVLPHDKSTFELRNGLEYSVGNTNKIKIAELAISNITKNPVVIGPPVSGGPWTAIYDPSWERGHRRVVYTKDNVDRIPGRFAIDFIKMDGSGQNTIRNEDEVKNWIGYGADVLAVADGFVASTNDEFSESPTISAHKDYPPEKATGNYISIEIGTKTYAFYEHLKPGSIKVKPGQAVKKGDVIASLGFTGNTTGPHLHFHIANADSPLGAEGIAYEFDSFFLLGSYPTLEKFGKVIWNPNLSFNKKRIAEHPAPNTVIVF